MKTKKKKNEPEAIYWEEPAAPVQQAPVPQSSAPVQQAAPTAAPSIGGTDYLDWLDREVGTAHAQAAARTAAAAPPQDTLGYTSGDYLAWMDTEIASAQAAATAPPEFTPGYTGSDYLDWLDRQIKSNQSVAPLRPITDDVRYEVLNRQIEQKDRELEALARGDGVDLNLSDPLDYARYWQRRDQLQQERDALKRDQDEIYRRIHGYTPDEGIMLQDLEIFNSWSEEEQEAAYWHLDYRVGGQGDVMNVLAGTPLSVEEAARGRGYQELVDKYGKETVDQVLESVDRWRNQQQAALEAAEAQSISENSGILGFGIARGINLASTPLKPLGIWTSNLYSTGRYSTADPNNWGGRYANYSGTLDATNADLAGRRLTNFLEITSRAVQNTLYGPGTADLAAPRTWYDDMEGTALQQVMDTTGSISYQATASAADNMLREGVAAVASGGSSVARRVLSSALVGLDSFADSYTASTVAGASPLEAAGIATADACLEVLTEYLPFEVNLNFLNASADTIFGMVTGVLSEAIEEIPEELTAGFGSTLTEILIRRDESEFMTDMNQARAQGKTDAQAFWYALGQEGLEQLYGCTVAFLSASISGSARAAGNMVQNAFGWGNSRAESAIDAPGTDAQTAPANRTDGMPGQTAPQQNTAQSPAAQTLAEQTREADAAALRQLPQGGHFQQAQAQQNQTEQNQNPQNQTEQNHIQQNHIQQNQVQQNQAQQNQAQQQGQAEQNQVQQEQQQNQEQAQQQPQEQVQQQSQEQVQQQNQEQVQQQEQITQQQIQQETQQQQVQPAAEVQQTAQNQQVVGNQQVTETQQVAGNQLAMENQQITENQQTTENQQSNESTPTEAAPPADAATPTEAATQVEADAAEGTAQNPEEAPSITPEQRLENLTESIKETGLTTGKATMAAQEMVAKAESTFGENSDAALDAYEPGQNPRQFLNGFQNAYILGTLGEHTALQDSKAAAYLTQEQRDFAFELGRQSSTGNQSTMTESFAGATSEDGGILHTRGEVGEKAIPYSERGIEIETRLMQYLENLHRNGDYISRKKGEVQYRDLAILTTETGAEYTSVTIGEDTYLVRGDSLYTTIPQEILDLVISQQGSIDCHSHPFIGDLIPSEADMKMMEMLTWMDESVIIDPTQRVAKFNKNGLISMGEEFVSRNEDYYQNMIWGEE